MQNGARSISEGNNPVAATPVQTETDTIAECINLLHSMPQITDGSPLYASALNSFVVKDKRILLMRLRSDEGSMTFAKLSNVPRDWECDWRF